MIKPLFKTIISFALLASFFLTAEAQPPGFVDRVYASGFNQMIGLTFDPLGRMYAWERDGRIYILENGLKTSNPVLDLRTEVGGWRDFGLLSVQLDPDFLNNGYIYLLYTVDYKYERDGGATDQQFAAYGRITRYQITNPTANIDVVSVDLSSRTILLGTDHTNGFPCTHQSHHVGYISFGADSTLLAVCGDAASYSTTDQGGVISGGWVTECLTDGILTPQENIGAWRSQADFSLNGKMVRIDRMTGDGIPSNPNYDPLNPTSIQSRTWARGLRNPCRMTRRPGTGSTNPALGDPGVFYIGDVGWNRREELNICDGPDQNFGWPRYEGFDVRNDYNNSLYYPGTNGIPAHKPPTFDWRNGRTARVLKGGTVYDMGASGNPVGGSSFVGNCSIGGVWYTGTDFPADYQNSYYHADYGPGWIQQFVFDSNNEPIEVNTFLPNGGRVTGLATNPISGGLYYVNNGGVIRKITYVGTNLPPTAVALADQYTGSDGLEVSFRGNRSSDPESDPISYLWDFGDGTTSTDVNPIHVFNSPAGLQKKFKVTLTVDDGNGFPDIDSLVISLHNTPPVILSTSIDSKHYYSGTETVNLSAVVNDAEDNASDLTLEWQTFLYHDNHNHPEPVDAMTSTTTTLSPIGCDGILYFYRVVLKVTDSGGLTTTYEKDIYPDCGGAGNQPVARFTLKEVSTKPYNYSFDGLSSYDLDGQLVSYAWDFGDGKTSNGPTASHTYFEEGSYIVTLTVTDQDANTNTTTSVISIACSNNVTGSPTGTLEYERYNGISGTSLSNIDWDNDPSNTLTSVTLAETPTNVADNYGGRLRGYIYPPQTGTYRMWIASDDQGVLLVSTNDDPANAVEICNVPSWASSRQWTKFADQEGSVNLTSGRKYYFEARFKEGGGGDNLAIRWELPDGTMEEPIPASRISPWDGGAYPILWKEDFHMVDGSTTDAGGTNWTLGTGSLGASASFDIRSQSLEGSHLDGEAVWTSDIVDISQETSVKVSFLYKGSGVFEPADYLRVYYKLNGGAEQELLNLDSSFPSTWTNFTSSDLNGNSIQIIVRMRNNEATELLSVDGISVSSNGNINAGGISECANCATAAASKTALRGQFGSCVSEFENTYIEIQDQYEEALIRINDNNQDLGLVKVETFDHGNHPFVNGDYYYLTRSFRLTTEKTFANPVTIQLYIQPSEFQILQDEAFTVNDLNDLVLEKYSNGELGEVGVGNMTTISPTSVSEGTGPGGSHVLTYSVPSFSTFFIRASQTTFPVEWLDFRVEEAGLDGLLKWEVGQDGKGSHFDVERSTNGEDFMNIAKVAMDAPEGASNAYSFVDKNIAALGSNTLYYRLRQFDFDGQTTLSPIRILRINVTDKPRMTLYPNPASGEFTLRYYLPENTEAKYEIISNIGVVLSEGTLVAGQARVQISTSQLAAGLYFVKMKHPMGTITQKIVIK
ncbi:MAG: PKD domain-containing protein [Bacteroidota bacterium]